MQLSKWVAGALALASGIIAIGAAAAAGPRPPLSAAEAEHLQQAAQACPGGEIAEGKLRTAAEIARSLPAAGDDGAGWDQHRGQDAYGIAHSLLVPALPQAERAMDRSDFLRCTGDPPAGARLMLFLAGERPRDLLAWSNTFYWLGQAYRRGGGVPADPAKARTWFLKARIMGQEQLTAADWGERPDQPIAELLARPWAHAWLEEAAAMGIPSAQLLLADLVLRKEPGRARQLLEAAVAQQHRPSVLRLAALELNGGLGTPNPGRAVEVLAAHASRYPADAERARLMVEAASRYNGGAVPVAARRLMPADVDVKKLLAAAGNDLVGDDEVGRVSTRGLLAPDGRILYVVIADPYPSFELSRAAMRVYSVERLPRVAPETVNGRAVFAWVDLPVLDFRFR